MTSKYNINATSVTIQEGEHASATIHHHGADPGQLVLQLQQLLTLIQKSSCPEKEKVVQEIQQVITDRASTESKSWLGKVKEKLEYVTTVAGTVTGVNEAVEVIRELL